MGPGKAFPGVKARRRASRGVFLGGLQWRSSCPCEAGRQSILEGVPATVGQGPERQDRGIRRLDSEMEVIRDLL